MNSGGDRGSGHHPGDCGPPGATGAPAQTGRGEQPGGPGRRQVLRVAASGLVAAAGAGCGTGAPRARPTPLVPDRGTYRLSGHAPLKGTSAWRLASVGPPDAIEGYADRVSVLPGEAFALHVSTTARSFRVSAFRVGWYGGAQAALVWASHTVRGSRQVR